MKWTQTARFGDQDEPHLLKDMDSLHMSPLGKTALPTHNALEVDTSLQFQEVCPARPPSSLPRRRAPIRLHPPHSHTPQILGFGGAFTEAAAINWRSLSPKDQERVIALYFNGPEEGGLGYTLGRVPINSCDFSPASYNFDDGAGDTNLNQFDNSVSHDEDSGMLPMIRAAQDAVKKRKPPPHTKPGSAARAFNLTMCARRSAGGV